MVAFLGYDHCVAKFSARNSPSAKRLGRLDNSPCPPPITRTLKACKALGILPSDIEERPLKSFAKPGWDKDVQAYAHGCTRRVGSSSCARWLQSARVRRSNKRKRTHTRNVSVKKKELIRRRKKLEKDMVSNLALELKRTKLQLEMEARKEAEREEKRRKQRRAAEERRQKQLREREEFERKCEEERLQRLRDKREAVRELEEREAADRGVRRLKGAESRSRRRSSRASTKRWNLAASSSPSSAARCAGAARW